MFLTCKQTISFLFLKAIMLIVITVNGSKSLPTLKCFSVCLKAFKEIKRHGIATSGCEFTRVIKKTEFFSEG